MWRPVPQTDQQFASDARLLADKTTPVLLSDVGYNMEINMAFETMVTSVHHFLDEAISAG